MKVTDHLRSGNIRATQSGLMDRLYARMLDGRTIQQHLELVAPIIEEFGSSIALTHNFSWNTVYRESKEYGLDYFCTLVQVVPLKNSVTYINSSSAGESHLGDVAKVFFLRWIELEACLLATSAKDILAVTDLANIFAESVLYELSCRRGTPSVKQELSVTADSLLYLLDRLSPFRLTQELLAYWYPGWCRSLFIFDSPFDYLCNPNDLRRFLEEHACSI
ncbi:hypothetical protein [Nostoc sp. FACHB-145]|uniref:hypothetical protein n=1 Tax=Nostoc sp. FACHB-145 TaxID=2692836 RepID=UPI00168427AF|nr:hypothetical protein [Nostoc sp. FACHB-145]MBD2470943.1 hypothetical protein [Nostoc sp. FACHB-145]